jgi:Fasciclin domain/Short C-terminal domain
MSLLHRERKMVEAANESGNFNTLVSAVKTADLVDALDAPGPLTLFAPTDEAFRKLPKGTVEQLMGDRAMLRNVLQHHVVAGKVMAKDAISTHSYRALDGRELNIDTCEGMTVNGAKVIKADMPAKNGVIHAIDTVLMPGMEATKPAMAGMGTEGMTGKSAGMSTGSKVAAGTAATGAAVGAAATSTKEKTGMGGKDVSKSMDSEMQKLQSMKDSGQISEAEFQARKKDLMSGKM